MNKIFNFFKKILSGGKSSKRQQVSATINPDTKPNPDKKG